MSAAVTRIARFSIVTADLSGATALLRALGFALVARHALPGPYADLYGLPGARIEEVLLKLGDEHVALLAFDPPGASYPPASTSTDLWFQHLAIIVSDMDAAYERLRAHGRFTPVSTAGPETLPASSGGVRAFKFRDREGHPLELLAFPREGGPAHWARRAQKGLFLGIDHTAIAVGDSGRSIAFFERALGLKLGPQSINLGPEQSRMDDVREAHVQVSGLLPARAPPHLELLGYDVGPRRPIALTCAANDIAATMVTLETPDLAAVVAALRAEDARFVSPGPIPLPDGTRGLTVLDPDGHRFCLVQGTRA